MTKITYIPGEIANAAIDEHGNRKPVTRTQHIFDDAKNKNQAEINADVDDSINQLSNEIDAVNKQDIIPVDALPAVATADPIKIYRVVGEDSYTDYMINASGDGWKTLATYSFPGIDNEPTDGSDNLVKSGGTRNLIDRLKPVTSSVADLSLEDENHMAIVLFKGGHIKTKNFNSENILQKINTIDGKLENVNELPSDKDLSLEDINGNTILILEDGNVRTKNFKSKDVIIPFYVGKVFGFYGDSITAQGNGDYEDPFNESDGWMNRTAKGLKLSKYFGRGVGGQTYKWNDIAYYCKANSTGNYVNRYKAVNGVISSENGTVTINATPEEISAIESVLGYNIEIHRGCLCSWDRITSMFPTSIKDDINVVMVMGGTNDFSGVEDIHSEEADGSLKPLWSPDNTTDVDWINSSSYIGGDYDVTTSWGALASTVMKLRIWMPNAQIILMTPIARKGINYNSYKNIHDADYFDLAESIIEVSKYINVPCLDMCSECGINQFNMSRTLNPDGIHPIATGWELMSKFIIEKLS